MRSAVSTSCATGALASSDEGQGLYTALGWTRWSGPTAVLTPDGRRMTPDAHDLVFLRPVTVCLNPTHSLVCDWRDGDVW